MDWLEKELATSVCRRPGEIIILTPVMYASLKAEADQRGETIPDWVIRYQDIPRQKPLQGPRR